jgi:hypothetical protein
MSTLDQVRLLTRLTDTELSDDQILDWLEFTGDVPRLAAAEALESYASSLMSVTSDDITLDGSKRATQLMARANSLRAQQATADADDEGGFFFDVAFPTSYRPELTDRGQW